MTVSSEATCYTTAAAPPLTTCDTIVAGKRKKRDVSDVSDVIDSTPKTGDKPDSEKDGFRILIRPSATVGSTIPAGFTVPAGTNRNVTDPDPESGTSRTEVPQDKDFQVSPIL